MLRHSKDIVMRNCLLFAVLLGLLPSPAVALEFHRVGGTFSMHGEIRHGDFIKFMVHFATWKKPPTIFHIDSPGGDLEDAMKIGRIIRESYIPIWTGEECSSACVFMFVAGVERVARSRLGLHRPYYDQKYFAKLNPLDAKLKYDELKKESVDYLKEMDVPQDMIERIFKTNSSDIDYLDEAQAKAIFGYRLPFYDEWLASKCGRYTEEEERVLGAISALRAIRAAYTLKVPAKGFGDNIAEKALLALQLEREGRLQPYIALSEKRSKCEEKNVNSYIFTYHKLIKDTVNDLLETNEKEKAP